MNQIEVAQVTQAGFAVLLGVRVWMRYGPDIPAWHQPQIPMENPLSNGIRYVAEKAFISIKDHPKAAEDYHIYGTPYIKRRVHACQLCNVYLEIYNTLEYNDHRVYHQIFHIYSQCAYLMMMFAANATGAVFELPYRAAVRSPSLFRKISLLVSQKISALFPSTPINQEIEKNIQTIEQNLQERMVLNDLSHNTANQFKEVVDEFHLMNDARSQVLTIISTELVSQSPVQLQQIFLSFLQPLTKELGNLAGEQPETLKVYVELAVQIDEEEQWSIDALAKIKKLKKELPAAKTDGIESKGSLLLQVTALVPLVLAVTPGRVIKLPQTIQSGGYLLGSDFTSLITLSNSKA